MVDDSPGYRHSLTHIAYTHTHTHICQSQACVTFCSQLICVIVSYNMWYMRVAIHITAHVCWLHIIEVRMSIWLCVKYYAFNNDLVTSTMSSHNKNMRLYASMSDNRMNFDFFSWVTFLVRQWWRGVCCHLYTKHVFNAWLHAFRVIKRV